MRSASRRVSEQISSSHSGHMSLPLSSESLLFPVAEWPFGVSLEEFRYPVPRRRVRYCIVILGRHHRLHERVRVGRLRGWQ